MINFVRKKIGKSKKETVAPKMPETASHPVVDPADTVTMQWLQAELRTASETLIVLDCRSTNEFQEGHIRSAVNFSIPSIMLRRLAAGKIDLQSTIKCRDLKQRIERAYNASNGGIFVLYNDGQSASAAANSSSTSNSSSSSSVMGGGGGGGGYQQQQQQANNSDAAVIINVLHRRLKQDGCRVFCLEGNCDVVGVGVCVRAGDPTRVDKARASFAISECFF